MDVPPSPDTTSPAPPAVDTPSPIPYSSTRDDLVMLVTMAMMIFFRKLENAEKKNLVRFTVDVITKGGDDLQVRVRTAVNKEYRGFDRELVDKFASYCTGGSKPVDKLDASDDDTVDASVSAGGGGRAAKTTKPHVKRYPAPPSSSPYPAPPTSARYPPPPSSSPYPPPPTTPKQQARPDRPSDDAEWTPHSMWFSPKFGRYWSHKEKRWLP